MTREEIYASYDVDSHGIIRTPGRFESFHTITVLGQRELDKLMSEYEADEASEDGDEDC